MGVVRIFYRENKTKIDSKKLLRIKKEVQKMQGAQKIREVMQLFEIEDLLEIERFLNWTKELLVDVVNIHLLIIIITKNNLQPCNFSRARKSKYGFL